MQDNYFNRKTDNFNPQIFVKPQTERRKSIN